ncbi:MAG: fimbrillin family protein [Parabacteroides gordonii]|nr:fimbrillin family protein [Parabacteroides gordonii]
MKTIQAITAMMLAYLALTACNKEEFPPDRTTPDGNGNAIRITATMGDFTGNSPDTRATIDEASGTGSFEKGDQILVYATPNAQTSGLFRTATFDGTSWKCNIPLQWSDLPEDESGKGYSFTGYYPVLTTTPEADNYIDFTVESDQSTQEDYAASDLLMSTTIVERGKDVKFILHHFMARILMTLTASEGVTPEVVNNATVRIKNMRVNSQVDLRRSSISVPLDPVYDDITPLPSATSPGTFYAIVPPFQTLAAGRIEVTADGQTFTYQVPDNDDLEFYQGQTTRVNLTLKRATPSPDSKSATTSGELEQNNHQSYKLLKR